MDKESLKLLTSDHASSRNKLELPYLPSNHPNINKQSTKFTSPLRFLTTVRKDSNPGSTPFYQRKYDQLTPIIKQEYENGEELGYRIHSSSVWKQDKSKNRLSTHQDRQRSLANEHCMTSEIEEEETMIQSSSPNSSTLQHLKSKTFYNSQKKAIYQRKLIGLPYQQEIFRYKKMYGHHHKMKSIHSGCRTKAITRGSPEFQSPIPDSMLQFEVKKKGQEVQKEKPLKSRIVDYKQNTISKKDLLPETRRTDSRTHSTTSLYDRGSDNIITDHSSIKISKEVKDINIVIAYDKKKIKKIKRKTKKKMTNVSVSDVMKQIEVEAEAEQKKLNTQEEFKRSTRAISKFITKPQSPSKPNPMKSSQPSTSIGKPRQASHIYRNNISAPPGSDFVDKASDFIIKKKPPHPPTVAERTDLKSREENIDTLLKNRTSLDHEKLMEEYNKRKGYDEKTKVFILYSQDDHIRRILKKKGWSENKHLISQAFHLRWSYTDSESDYKSLRPGQLFNHFPNNRELTTKSGLCKNLRSVDRYGVDIDSFFPRCYDLGIQSQIEEFKEDFKKQEICNTVKRHAEYFMKTKEEDLCIVNTKCLMHAVEYTRHLIDTLNDNCERQEKYSFMQEFDSVFSIASDDMKHLRYYCVYTLPLSFMSRDDMLKTSYSYEMEYVWVKPSPELIQKTIDIHNLMIKTYPQAYMEGNCNVWIVKPGQNARGSGIYCIKDMETIINLASKMSARVIQKYIERPLLLPTSKGFCKFDIRQWVLVTSFEPLTIYMYNSSYLRLCLRPYDLNNISDTYSHLANFSLQKNVAKNAEDTVWSLERFLEYLKSEYPNTSWENDILPKIHRMVVYTLEAVAHNIESRSGSFELYGFDIILDEMFVPWLLEANLSPACAERTPWLRSMLDSMAEGLFEILIEGRSNTVIYDEELKLQGSITANSPEWVLVYKVEGITHDDKDGQGAKINSCQLEILGEKLNIRKEKQLERRYQMNRAMTLIQSVVRCFLQKRRYIRYKQILTSTALKIQRWYRQILYQKALTYKKLKESSISLSYKTSVPMSSIRRPSHLEIAKNSVSEYL